MKRIDLSVGEILHPLRVKKLELVFSFYKLLEYNKSEKNSIGDISFYQKVVN